MSLHAEGNMEFAEDSWAFSDCEFQKVLNCFLTMKKKIIFLSLNFNEFSVVFPHFPLLNFQCVWSSSDGKNLPLKILMFCIEYLESIFI